MERLSPCWSRSFRQDREQGQARLMKVTVSVAQVPHPSEQLSPQKPGLHPRQAIESKKLKDEK